MIQRAKRIVAAIRLGQASISLAVVVMCLFLLGVMIANVIVYMGSIIAVLSTIAFGMFLLATWHQPIWQKITRQDTEMPTLAEKLINRTIAMGGFTGSALGVIGYIF